MVTPRAPIITSPCTGDYGLSPGSDYATPANASLFGGAADVPVVDGTLSFKPGVTSLSFTITPLHNPGMVFDRDCLLWALPEGGDQCVPGYVNDCTLTILHENSPAGAIDSTFNPANDPFTPRPYNTFPGANGPVYAIAMQPDGKAVIAGEFTDYNQGGVNNKPNINRVARINTDGQIDQTFDPGDGADAFVSAVALDRAGNLVLGGAFTSFNRDLHYGINGIVRLKPTGAIDTSFFAGQGANGIIRTIAIDTNQNILIAGEFTSFNGTNRNYIARLNPDGSLDSTFDTSAGPDGFVRGLAVQPDGRVFIGGEFTHVGGIARNHLARLNTDGSLDTSFDPGHGLDGPVYAAALQRDGRVLFAGDFQTASDVSLGRIARYNPDGSLDQNFQPGSGADDPIYNLNVQPDGTIYVAGIFTSYNGTRRIGLARSAPGRHAGYQFSGYRLQPVRRRHQRLLGPHPPAA